MRNSEQVGESKEEETVKTGKPQPSKCANQFSHISVLKNKLVES